MDEKTPTELAFTLNYLVEQGLVPGLLPRDVRAAAELLVRQEKQIQQMITILATNEHTVQIEAKRLSGFTGVEVKLTFGIVSPRTYRSETRVGMEAIYQRNREEISVYLGRQMFRVGSQEWQREMEEKTARAVYGCDELWKDPFK